MPDNLNAVDPAILTSGPAMPPETTEEVPPVSGTASPAETPPNPAQEHGPDPAPEAAAEQEPVPATAAEGDFVGHTVVGGVTRPPVPMADYEVDRMLRKDQSREKGEVAPTPVISKPKFDRGDRLRVNDGTFAGMEGEVMEINQEKGLV